MVNPQQPLSETQQAFCESYQIGNIALLQQLYEIDELVLFMPPRPTAEQVAVFNQLLGAQADSGYLDYTRSTNTFELIMQWREQTGQWEQ
ncbi:MAG TPA: hypothetical protein DCM08_09805 [Microscillaceae bacterium]|nr:hypothetical protein [Microscillaceae bacterium]